MNTTQEIKLNNSKKQPSNIYNLIQYLFKDFNRLESHSKSLNKQLSPNNIKYPDCEKLVLKQINTYKRDSVYQIKCFTDLIMNFNNSSKIIKGINYIFTKKSFINLKKIRSLVRRYSCIHFNILLLYGNF